MTDKVVKILNAIGLTMTDIEALNQTDTLILYRIFEAVQDYSMYHNKSNDLENQCEEIKSILRKHLNQMGVIK